MNQNLPIKKILFVIVVILSTSITLLSCGSSRRTIAVEEGWEILGERKVGFVGDKDEITVSSRHDFTALRFAVEDNDIRINYLKVYYRNGDVLQPAIDEVIPKNQSSRIIELAKEGRTIDKIEFRYHTTSNDLLKGRANVIVFGKRYYAGGY